MAPLCKKFSGLKQDRPPLIAEVNVSRALGLHLLLLQFNEILIIFRRGHQNISPREKSFPAVLFFLSIQAPFPLIEFTLFPELVVELRLQICCLLLLGLRILELLCENGIDQTHLTHHPDYRVSLENLDKKLYGISDFLFYPTK